MMTTVVPKSKPIRKNDRFDNPWSTWGGDPKFKNVVTWYFTRKEIDPLLDLNRDLPIIQPHFQENPSSGVVATWLGHATVLLQMDNCAILTDPIFSDRCSPLQYCGPKRRRPTPCTVKDLPDIDAVLISHNHYDHLDFKTVCNLNARFGAKLRWFVPLGLRRWFHDVGCKNVLEKSWWEESSFKEGGGGDEKNLQVIALPCQHWSYRNGFDRNKSLWCSWAVKGPRSSFYFVGDTGYCPEFRSIGHYYGPFTFSAIPIGCYKPRWFMKNQHVEPAESVKIHFDVKSEYSLGIHWGTYDMGSTEAPTAPKLELEKQLKLASIDPEKFFTLRHGESWTSSPHSNSSTPFASSALSKKSAGDR